MRESHVFGCVSRSSWKHVQTCAVRGASLYGETRGEAAAHLLQRRVLLLGGRAVAAAVVIAEKRIPVVVRGRGWARTGAGAASAAW